MRTPSANWRSLANRIAAVTDVGTSLSKVELRIGTNDQEGLLGEIQTELRTLPSRLDDYMGSPRFLGIRRGRFHPMMIRELLHDMSPRNSPAFGVLILASLFRHEAVQEFRQGAEYSIHGPMSREFMGRSKRDVHRHGRNRAHDGKDDWRPGRGQQAGRRKAKKGCVMSLVTVPSRDG